MKIDPTGTENIDVVRDNVARIVNESAKSNADLAMELLTAYDRESKLLGGIRKRENQIAKLKADIARRDAKLALVNERLERLLGSKAMQVQRAYWRLRRPNGGASSRLGGTSR